MIFLTTRGVVYVINERNKMNLVIDGDESLESKLSKIDSYIKELKEKEG